MKCKQKGAIANKKKRTKKEIPYIKVGVWITCVNTDDFIAWFDVCISIVTLNSYIIKHYTDNLHCFEWFYTMAITYIPIFNVAQS